MINRAITKSGPIDVHVISTDSPTRAPHEGSEPRREPSAPTVGPREDHRLGAGSGRHPAVRARPPAVQGRDRRPRDAAPAPAARRSAIAMLGGLAACARGAPAIAYVCADWFYIEPTHSLRFAHAGDALALVVFVAVSALVSGLVDRLARRTAQLARSQAETEALAELASGTALLDEDSLHRLVSRAPRRARPRIRRRPRANDRGMARRGVFGRAGPDVSGGRVVLSRARERQRPGREGALVAGGRSPVALGVRGPPASRPGHAPAPGRCARSEHARTRQPGARGTARRRLARPARTSGEHQGRGDQPAQRRREVAAGGGALVLQDDRRRKPIA